MLGHPEGVIPVLFNGIRYWLNVSPFIRPDNDWFSGYGGGVSQEIPGPPQPFPRKHVVFLVGGKTKKYKALPHHPRFLHIYQVVGMSREVKSRAVGFSQNTIPQGVDSDDKHIQKRNI